ncbi:septal ring lytic transglycosylase RlpA family protein [Glaciimonas sp. GG7]
MSLRHRNYYRTISWSALAALLILAGCSTAPPATDTRSPPPPSATKATPSIPVLPKAGSGRGGYYKDDGPGDDIPDGLENVADAVPEIEPYSRTGNKPYVVFGKTYTPLIDDQPFVQRGMGTWYGKKFHKKRTSSGEPYDMYKMTAAHPTLPIPSYARVTNLKTGKQVIVRINDRGPFHSTRIIDLSYTAALRLGYLGTGSGQLEVERLLPADILAIRKQAGASPALAPASESFAGAPDSDSPVSRPGDAIDALAADNQGYPSAPGYYLQLGAFTSEANAEATRQRLLQELTGVVSALDKVVAGGVYRVYAGPFASRLAAQDAAAQVRQRIFVSPMIVKK